MSVGPLDPAGPGPRRRELALVSAALALLTIVTHAHVVRHGGWIHDDWSWIGMSTNSDGVTGVYESFQGASHRLGAVLTWTAQYLIGGERQAPYLAMGAAFGLAQSVAVYAVLRLLALRVWLAAGAAALLLLFPAADTGHYWWAGTITTLSGAWMAAGLATALLAFRHDSRPLHGLSVALYVLAMLTYDTTAGPIALFGLVYALAHGWQRARVRWAVDVAATAASLVFLYLSGGGDRAASEDRLAYLWRRLDDFWRPDVLERLLPLDVLYGPLGLTLLAIAVAALAVRDRPALRTWAVVLGLATVLAAAGWALLLPAGEYYAPRYDGLGNRSNTTAAVGGSVAYAALAGLVAAGLAALIRHRFALPVLATAALAAWTVAFAGETRTHQRYVEDSWNQSSRVVAAIRDTVPELTSDGRIVTFAHRTTVAAPGDYPVFVNPWELDGAIAWAYQDRETDGRPWLDAACGDEGVVFGDGTVFTYADLHFVDVGAYRSQRIEDREGCDQAVATLPAPSVPYVY